MITKKAFAVVSAFFVCGFFISPVLASKCVFNKNAGSYETVKLDHVIDGDTLRLKDGRKVRIISINTPEVAWEYKPEEPYGNEARSAAKAFFKGHKTLRLQTSSQDKDNYGRILGHIFLPNGTSLSESLLQQGLAFQVFGKGRNYYQNCLKSLEQKAREKGVGVWSISPETPADSKDLHGGFMVINGTLEKISRPKNSAFIWLELKGSVVLRVPKKAASQSWFHSIRGKEIEVRGWMVDRTKSKKTLKKGLKRWVMLVYQIDAVEVGI